MVGDGIGRDAVEPGDERNAAPLEPPEVGERLLKDLGGRSCASDRVATRRAT
jgi:hypothetical protein